MQHLFQRQSSVSRDSSAAKCFRNMTCCAPSHKLISQVASIGNDKTGYSREIIKICVFVSSLLIFYLFSDWSFAPSIYISNKKISFRVIPQAQVAYVNKIQNSLYTGKNIQNNINNILRRFHPPSREDTMFVQNYDIHILCSFSKIYK